MDGSSDAELDVLRSRARRAVEDSDSSAGSDGAMSAILRLRLERDGAEGSSDAELDALRQRARRAVEDSCSSPDSDAAMTANLQRRSKLL